MMAKMMAGKDKNLINKKLNLLEEYRKDPKKKSKAMNFFKKNTLHIEVLREDGNIEKVR